jgi:DNA-directed RNA polymerase alpha subunit
MVNVSGMVEHQIPMTPNWKKIIDDSYNTEVGKLEFSFRVQWRLYYEGIKTVDQLCDRTVDDILKIKGLGYKALVEIKQILESIDRNLKGDK